MLDFTTEQIIFTFCEKENGSYNKPSIYVVDVAAAFGIDIPYSDNEVLVGNTTKKFTNKIESMLLDKKFGYSLTEFATFKLCPRLYFHTHMDKNPGAYIGQLQLKFYMEAILYCDMFKRFIDYNLEHKKIYNKFGIEHEAIIETLFIEACKINTPNFFCFSRYEIEDTIRNVSGKMKRFIENAIKNLKGNTYTVISHTSKRYQGEGYELVIEHDNRIVDYEHKTWRMSQNSNYLEFLVLKTDDNKSELKHYNDMIVALDVYPQYLRAGAGTGKTEVLIQKILYILKNDLSINLKNFGIITFTNKATEEMRTRLADSIYREWVVQLYESKNMINDNLRVQAEMTNMIDICTIHGFCERLLRQYGLTIGLPLNFKIKSFRYNTRKIISDVVGKHHNNSLLKGIPQYRVAKLIDVLMTNNSNHGIVLGEETLNKTSFSTPNNHFWNDFKSFYLGVFQETFNKIEQGKIAENILTPNDLIRKTVELLKDNYIATKVAENYKYLFIDEFQDTNRDQFDFVSILISNGVKIFLVGDEKQSVYAFRGADVENSRAMSSLILEFKKLQDDKSYYLDENFRTDGKLIELINRIFAHEFTFDGTHIYFPVEPLAVPKCKKETGDENCLEFIFTSPMCDVVKRMLTQNINGKKIEFGDIAILCRRNFDLDKIAGELKQAGFPVEVVGGKGFYKAKEIVDTYKIFNAVINNEDKYYNELLFSDYYKAIKSNVANLDFDNFLVELETIFRRETVEEILTFIFEKSCIFEFYAECQNYQAISNLHKLKNISRSLMNKENMQPLQFLDYLSIMISSGQEEDEADVAENERKKGVIRLYSIHKAKGLAFPVVIVPNLDNKLNRPITKPMIILDIKSDVPRIAIDNEAVSTELPTDKDFQSLLQEKVVEHLAEEVRVFYVACTRAKHKLVLCSRRPLAFTDKVAHINGFASIFKWLIEVENGKLLKMINLNN